MDADVLVVGAGPVGLLLASELALGGARVLVLERRSDLAAEPIKQGEMGARSLNAPSVHALRRRGLLPNVRNAALMWWDPNDRPTAPPSDDEPPPFAGHFAGIMLRADRIDFEDPDLAGHEDGAGVIAQADLERILGDRARELGVTIRTGVTVTDVRQTADAVTAVTEDGPVSARWLVGCDGGRSVVRKQSGIAFPGEDAESVFRLALVDMTEPEKLLPGGMHECEGGYYLLGGWEMRLRPTRITTIEPGTGIDGDRDAPMTAQELQDSIRRVCGIDTEITAIHAATRYADTTRQAATYRSGRVLLAGDAAHVHSPAGGQGLNLGISDAMNLGWKLAAVIKGEAEESLLDTYTEERHPIGAWVQDWTKAQAAITRRDPRTKALRAVLTDLLDTKAGTTYVLKKIAGVALRYGLPGGHPLTGKLVPSRLATDDAATDGRFVLATNDPILTDLAAQWPNRITTVPQSPDGTSLLIRPDGIVCWASEHPESAPEQWPTWLGRPTAGRLPVAAT